MIRRWFRGCLLPSALCLAAVGCTTSVESLTGGLIAGPSAGPRPADDAPPHASDDLPPDQQARLCLDTARELDRAGDDESALQQYEHLLTLDPGNVTAMRRLCVLYDRQARWDKAEEFYKKLARSRPNDADLWSDWGYSFYLRAGEKNWTEAETRLRQALKINPKHERAHSNLGLVLGQLKRYPEAYQEFRAAQLNDAEAHCDLAFVYWTQNKMDEAKKECRKARDMDSSCLKARDMLATLEKPPQPREDKGKGRDGDRTASSRSDGHPRASALTSEQWEAERELARRIVANGVTGTPAPAADRAAPPQTPGPITLPSGTRWMPVNAGATPTAAPQAPATGGTQGTVTFGNE
jgi:Tfp pilus assembly protein PilF